MPSWKPEQAQNAFVIIKANEYVRLHLSNDPLTGVLAFERGAGARATIELEDNRHDELVVLWGMKNLVRRPFCFRALPDKDAYSAANSAAKLRCVVEAMNGGPRAEVIEIRIY